MGSLPRALNLRLSIQEHHQWSATVAPPRPRAIAWLHKLASKNITSGTLLLLDESSSLLTLPSNSNNNDRLDGGDGSNNGGVGGKNVIEGK